MSNGAPLRGASKVLGLMTSLPARALACSVFRIRFSAKLALARSFPLSHLQRPDAGCGKRPAKRSNACPTPCCMILSGI